MPGLGLVVHNVLTERRMRFLPSRAFLSLENKPRCQQVPLIGLIVVGSLPTDQSVFDRYEQQEGRRANASSFCGAKRKSDAEVRHPSTICSGSCPTNLQDLPGSVRSPLSAPTTNSLLARVYHSSNRSRTDESASPLEVEI